MDIQDKTAIVTGAGSGIGQAIAVELARNGANVVCVGRRVERLKETVDRIAAEGGRAGTAPADVTDPAGVAEMTDRAVRQYGSVDILFNNAGSFDAIGGLWEVDPETWWNDVTVNLRGVMLASRAALQHMMPRDEGIIINMNGGGSTVPMAGGSGYASSKAGMLRLTDCLAAELKKVNSSVLVVSLGPGLVRTEMTEIQVETEAGRTWLPGTARCFQEGKTRPPTDCAEATIRLIRHACPAFSGRVFGPDDDFAALAEGSEELVQRDARTLRFRSK